MCILTRSNNNTFNVRNDFDKKGEDFLEIEIW